MSRSTWVRTQVRVAIWDSGEVVDATTEEAIVAAAGERYVGDRGTPQRCLPCVNIGGRTIAVVSDGRFVKASPGPMAREPVSVAEIVTALVEAASDVSAETR